MKKRCIGDKVPLPVSQAKIKLRSDAGYKSGSQVRILSRYVNISNVGMQHRPNPLLSFFANKDTRFTIMYVISKKRFDNGNFSALVVRFNTA